MKTPRPRRSRYFIAASAHLLAALAIMPATAAFGEVIYENDFTTRRSAYALPTSSWYEMAYQVGPLARNYNKQWELINTPYIEQSNVQDGWALANIGRNDNTYVMAAPVVVTNSLEEVPEGDPANQFVTVYGTTSARTALAVHPLFNSFSNGVLRISADFRAPVRLETGAATDMYLRIAPICKSQMDNLNWTSSATLNSPTAFGIQWRTIKDDIAINGAVPFLMSGEGDTTSAIGFDFSRTSLGRNWCRLVANIDFDAKTVECKAYNLGLGNPTRETQGTLINTSGSKQFYRPVTAANGPITGIGLYFRKVFATSGVVTNAVCVDNLAVSWKAPGATTFQDCYENDFSVRRYRTLTPPGTTNVTYDAYERVTVTDSYNYPADTTKVVPDSDTTLKNVSPQPLGVDSWRRINDDGLGEVVVTDSALPYCGPVLAVKANEKFACVSQPLTQEITSGKVRMVADICKPNQWYWRYRRAAIDMGTTSFASTLHKDFNLNRIGEVGIGASESDSETAAYPRYYDNTGEHYMTSTNCPGRTWWRVVRTVDIDNQTYDFEIYRLVNGATNEPPVVSVTGVNFRQEVRSIGSFALIAYGPGNEGSKAILFDNIKVWKGAGTAQETLIYSNDFTTRTRSLDVSRVKLATMIDRQDCGTDCWIRRNNGVADIYVQQAENPAVAVASGNQYAYLLQPFGRTVTHGTVRARVDIRPANLWQWSIERGAYLYLGDDTFLQGNLSQAAHFTSGRHVIVGVVPESTAADDQGLYYGSVPSVSSGSESVRGTALATTNWYRFCVTAPLDSPTYSVKVYDMGPTHPEMTTPNGTLVQSFDGLAYQNGAPVSGLTCFGLAEFGSAGTLPSDPEDPGNVFFDNIQIETTSRGFMLILR